MTAAPTSSVGGWSTGTGAVRRYTVAQSTVPPTATARRTTTSVVVLASRSFRPEARRTTTSARRTRPFGAELVVVRGANAPDALPRHERRLDDEITRLYGQGRTLAEVAPAWRPFRTWAAVHLRALREERINKITDE